MDTQQLLDVGGDQLIIEITTIFPGSSAVSKHHLVTLWFLLLMVFCCYELDTAFSSNEEQLRTVQPVSYKGIRN